MFRRGVMTLAAVFSLIAAGGLATATSAAAATGGGSDPTVTTTNFHGVQTFSSVDPCNGNLGVVTATSNIITHETFFPATGEAHATFTEEDNFTVVEATLTAAGHETIGSNFNLNQQNSNSSFIFEAHATNSNGGTLTFHEVAHFTLNPDGTITVSFDKVSLTCS